jgi:hypothetical protein
MLMDKQIQNLMRSLKISEAEARELIAYDNKVDKAKAKEKLEFDLSAEQEKETRKWRQAERKPTIYDFSKRERKPNILKGEIIQALFNFLNENSDLGIENCVISNKERMICFESGGEKFDLTLIQKRKPKEKSE